MSFLLTLALAATTSGQPDISRAEIEAAFRWVKTNSVVAVSDEKIAAAGAKYLSLTHEFLGREGNPEDVNDLPELVAYFEKLRAKSIGHFDERRLVEEAVNGMVSATGHGGGYYDPTTFSNLNQAGPAGIGVDVQLVDGFPTIHKTVAGAPSEGSLLKGDRVLSVDGQSTDGMSLDSFMPRLRGQVGSNVTLRIKRGNDTAYEVKLIRAIVSQAPAVTWRVEGSVGVIKISGLLNSTVADTKAAISFVKRTVKRPTGFVIDLRGNQGGLLDATIGIADIFLESGTVVTQKGRDRQDVERYVARRGDDTKGARIIALVNHDTASGAEIIAAALQDSKRALVVGQRTFGNGTVQTLLLLSDRSAIKLPTSQSFRPFGGPIDQAGVVPDVTVALDDHSPDSTLQTALELFEKSFSGKSPLTPIHPEAK